MKIYTVGHSNHPIEKFLALLTRHGITAVADVRSTPYSRRNPQFNANTLAAALAAHGIAYVSVGKELGARSEDPCCYEDGRVQYRRLAQTALFKQGLERVRAGTERYRVALMCAEKEPLDCHRTLLVSRALEAQGAIIAHILEGGMIEPHERTMARLVASTRLPNGDLFRNEAQVVDAACAAREQKIAYVRRS